MRIRSSGLIFISAICWAQQPYIYYRGIVNAASSMPPGLAGGAIARGSTISIYGTNLGPASSPTLSFPLQTTLGGVSLTFTQGSTSVAGIPVFVSPGQVNAIVPSNAPLGAVSVQLRRNNTPGNFAQIVVTNSNFGIFAVSGGRGPGIFQNFVSQNVQPVNSISAPAQPNQVITLWGTGLGAVTFPDNQAPVAGNLPVQTEVLIGGVPAKVTYNGRSPCCAGIDQIVFEVPSNTPTGCWVPVVVRTGGTAISNAVTMAITADGKKCSEPGNPGAAALINGGRAGRVLAARVATHHDVGVANTNDTVSDVSSAYFAEEVAGDFNFDPAVSLPPAGTCTVYTSPGDFSTNQGFPPGFPESRPTKRALDVGVTGIGAANTDTAFSHDTARPISFFGGSIPSITFAAHNSLFLNPGNFSVYATGGADSGTIQAPMTMPGPLTWGNRDQLQSIDRRQGFTVNWSSAASGYSVFVAGGGADLPVNASGFFVCLARPGDTSLTVPPYILANLPAARTRLVQSRGVVYVGQWPLGSPPRISSSSLDAGVILPVQVLGRTVVLK